MKNHEKKKQIPLRIAEPLLKKAQEDAALKGVSFNRYIEIVLSETARSEEHPSEESACWIRVDQETGTILKKKARHAGVSLQEYLHTCTNTTPPVVLQVKISDLDDLSNRITALIETVNAVARVLLRRETASPEEVDRMIRELHEIHESFKRQYRFELENRERLYREAKSALTGLVNARYPARTRSSTRSSSDNPGDDHAGSPG